ncbi:hypothetical protein EJ02DRAFT_450379 [Clathrospora elynae]|uniref:Zn(2)-C6 fungal-type domain-containing protein n=1 Tax=Clathrospora elynae TaxID=706981 RepID=A0A6A5T3M4_9PLEO|nr:hypothetical protein EJ02DRAFT_450379 [Clathrospora elynae]
MDPSSDSKRIERVVLACVQCRSRHVKCDSTQPICKRCERDGKEGMYQKSRRGGLDKAALARRHLRVQKEAEGARQDHHAATTYMGNQTLFDVPSCSPKIDAIQLVEPQLSQPISVVFQVNNNRLLELFFENFWPSFPVVLPWHYLQARRLDHNHGMNELLLVLQWIGSIYAPWSTSDPYYETALEALNSPTLAHTPFNFQALTHFAIAQYHCDIRVDARNKFNTTIDIALKLRMNERCFPQAYGEGNPVLEESWRRT